MVGNRGTSCPPGMKDCGAESFDAAPEALAVATGPDIWRGTSLLPPDIIGKGIEN